MRVEYLLLCKGDWDLKEFLLEALRETHALSESTRDELEFVVSLPFEKPCGQHPNGEALTLRKVALELEIAPEEEAQFFEDFHGELRDDKIPHGVKFYDDHLKRIRREYADEIFDIEMQLREALTFILWMNNPREPSALFNSNIVSPFKGDDPKHWKSEFENELFHIYFSDYPNLNERKSVDPKKLQEVILESSGFTDFQNRLSGALIAEEKFVDFLAQLKALVKPVEDVRNCAAHNSHVSKTKAESYSKGKQNLLDALKEFMSEHIEDDAN